MKAELMRAMVDVFNHIILYFANKWAKNDPDEFHNYGYGGYKNLAVIAPGLGFFFSGVYNTIFPMYATLYDVVPDELTINGLSLAAIGAVNVGELLLFYLNLGDVS
jgi:divalent metal cation (Fe/Co/Zn/Cd) transporter